MKHFAMSLAGAVLLAVLATTAHGVTIETVPVGNLGNIDDTTGVGYGAVDYAYNIGTYEVTAGQYTEFLNAVAGTDAYGLYNMQMDSDPYGCQITRHSTSGSYTYDFSGGIVESPGSTSADWENRPVNFVSWGDAARFANWLHNGQPTGTLTGDPVQDAGLTEDGTYYLNGATIDAALLVVNREADWKWAIPSEDEWHKPAYHKNDGDTGNYFDYPTSSDTAPDYVNDDGKLSGTGTVFTEGGTDPGNYATYDGDGGTFGIGFPYYRTKVGEWENSGSPYGTFDQGGNVWEWNEAVLLGLYRGDRGGSFSYGGGYMLASHRSTYNPTSEYSVLGFRLVQVPEPTTITLLLCGLVGLALLRRQR